VEVADGGIREPVAGETIDQYRLMELRSRGQTASVFRALDEETGASFALKVPHGPGATRDLLEHLRREEQVCGGLRHPHVVAVFTPRQRSRDYLVMEFVEGKDLRSVMQERGPLPAGEAVLVARQVCEALVYLHSKGVYHRDLKPENVFLTRDGAKVLDFGIASLRSRRRPAADGTPDYAAPEQIRGGGGDARTDIYALGTMLYEMLTGRLPFDAPGAAALLSSKLADEPRLPSYYVAGFDPLLEAVILKAIERRPSDRYASARQLLAHLRTPADRIRVEGPARPGRSRGAALSLVLAAILAALASLIWLTSHHSGPPRQAPTSEKRG